MTDTKVKEGEYVDHAGRRVQFTDNQTVQDAADFYQFVEQEYKGSKSIYAARLESILKDLQAGKPLDTDGWNVLSDLRRRYGKQFEQWRKTGKDGQDPTIPMGAGRISEALSAVQPSVQARIYKPDDGLQRNPTLAIDFDGVLHSGVHGVPGELEGPPMPGAPQAVKQLAKTYRIVVLTARRDFDAVRHWLKRNGMSDYVDDITNVKPEAAAYIDDRAIHFSGDWKDVLNAADPQIATNQPIVTKRTYEAEALRLAEQYATPSTTKKDKGATAAHLLDSVLHDLAHTRQHITRLLEPDVKGNQESIAFNAEHALNHADSGADHAHKLDDHLAEHPSDPKLWKSERTAINDIRSPNFKESELVRLALDSDSYMPRAISRLEESAAPKPPNYRPATVKGQQCDTCKMMTSRNRCWGYGNIAVISDYVCDSWEKDK